jgi:methylase of polypeptide subunit release factors
VTPPVPTTCQFGPIVVEHDDRVLTPRPWTLLQSQWAAELAAAGPAGALLELCAGAGQIGLAAAVLADRDLVQVEADPVAAGFARSNAARASRGDHVEIRVGRLQDAVGPGERFAVVIADPPYLPSADIARWPQDPVTAIDGGDDGLDLVRACVTVIAQNLAAGGSALMQVAGPAQAEQLAPIAAAAGLVVADVRTVDGERAVALLRRA